MLKTKKKKGVELRRETKTVELVQKTDISSGEEDVEVQAESEIQSNRRCWE